MPRLATATFAVLLISCSSTSTSPVAVQGNPASLASLAGKWVGQYESAAKRSQVKRQR